MLIRDPALLLMVLDTGLGLKFRSHSLLSSYEFLAAEACIFGSPPSIKPTALLFHHVVSTGVRTNVGQDILLTSLHHQTQWISTPFICINICV